MSRRVAITGLGAVTPVGVGVKAFWQALRAGTPGIGPVTLFDASPYYCRAAAEVRGFEAAQFMNAKAAATMTRFAQFGVAAARMAYDDAGLAAFPYASRFPVCFGSSAHAVFGELQDDFDQFFRNGSRRVSAATMQESASHAVTAHVTVALGLTGQAMTVATGCTTGIDVIQWAYQQIKGGLATGVLAGAAEAPLSTYSQASTCALGVLSRWPGPPSQALRPFDALHDGMVLGEGAGAFVLEELEHARARGAHVYGEVLGFGAASEAGHVFATDPTGRALASAVQGAIRMARIEPSDIDHINAHGNGLPEYDRAESAAYRAIFGRHAYSIPVSSIKPMTGQSLAAAGALQVVAACLTLEEQYVPPTLNHDIADPACDLDYVPERGRVARVNRLAVTAHAMGGSHSALVLARPDLD